MSLLPLWVWAPLAFLLYLGISWVVGDVFPFSKYALYASASGRRAGAVPVFLAEGAEARLSDFEAFAGIDPDGLYPRGFPCSLEWEVHEARRWISTHLAAPGAAPGAVAVAWGFRVITVHDDGSVHQRIAVVAQGTARPRGRAASA